MSGVHEGEPEGPFVLPAEDAFAAELTHVLQTVQADIHRSCRSLLHDTTGARLALLQRLSLRRSSQYAAFYKNAVLAQARQVQRQRSDLVKQLQRMAKQLLSPTPVPQQRARSSGPFEHFQSALALVQGACAAEQQHTEVTFVLCPSLDALRAFLHVAVTERGLHERVMAAVLSSSGGGQGEDEPADPDAAPLGNNNNIHNNAVDAHGGVAGGDAALGEALCLLFDAVEKTTAASPLASLLQPCTTEATSGSAAGPSPVVRVPVLLSLEQYLRDSPWCTTHDALTDDERRRRQKENPKGDEDPSERVGFLFTRDGLGSASPRKPAAAFAPLFGAKSRGGEDGVEEGDVDTTGLMADALHMHAQAVATEVTAAVDALWTAPEREAAVEELILELLRKARPCGKGDCGGAGVVDVDNEDSASGGGGKSDAGTVPSADGVRQVMSPQEEAQLTTIQEFLDVVRVFYCVELASRVLAVVIAGKMLKDSEDFVCLDGLRTVPLCVSPQHHPLLLPFYASTPSPSSPPQTVAEAGAGKSLGRLGEGSPVTADALLPVLVFNLPDTENVFYCTALTLGLALLRDYQACTRHAVTKDDNSNEEEEPLRLQKLGIDPATARAQKVADAWLSAFETAYLSLSPLADGRDAGGSREGAFAFTVAPALRLWQYLWEHVFLPNPPSSEGESDVDVVVAAATSATVGGTRAQECTSDHISLSYTRSRRWLERQVSAALLVGADHATLMTRPGEVRDTILSGSSSATELPLLFAATASRIRRHVMQLWRCSQ